MAGGGEKSYAEKGRQMDILTASAVGLCVYTQAAWKKGPAIECKTESDSECPKTFFFVHS